jgi:hypothetical protein
MRKSHDQKIAVFGLFDDTDSMSRAKRDQHARHH